ncbi:hypothetical protein HK102_009456, partial [Quaeritorhiza haematococci]
MTRDRQRLRADLLGPHEPEFKKMLSLILPIEAKSVNVLSEGLYWRCAEFATVNTLYGRLSATTTGELENVLASTPIQVLASCLEMYVRDKRDKVFLEEKYRRQVMAAAAGIPSGEALVVKFRDLLHDVPVSQKSCIALLLNHFQRLRERTQPVLISPLPDWVVEFHPEEWTGKLLAFRLGPIFLETDEGKQSIAARAFDVMMRNANSILWAEATTLSSK